MEYLIIETDPQGRRFINIRELHELPEYLLARALRCNAAAYTVHAIILVPAPKE